MIFNYTCRSSYHVFAADYQWSVVFHTVNEYSSQVFGSRFNRVSRNTGQSWSEVFNCCEASVWNNFSFHKQIDQNWF